MSEQLHELTQEAADEQFERIVESELATVGLAAMIEAHNDTRLPFGVGDFAQPVSLATREGEYPTPKWCNKRQTDGSWDSVIDGKD
jgi:hypothetical protein